MYRSATTTINNKNNVATMVTTRRSFQDAQEKPAYPLDPFEDRKRQRLLGAHAAGIQRYGEDTDECFHLLGQLFAQLRVATRTLVPHASH